MFARPQNSEERIHLITPQRNVTQAPAGTLKARERQGAGHFVKDTFEGYIQSENDFVYIVEHDNRNTEVMALLCMTYLQLWPYSHQDSRDSKSITTVVQWSSSVDPVGTTSATCRAVDLIVRGRFQEAKSLVEAQLDAHANEVQSTNSILFFKRISCSRGPPITRRPIGYLRSAEQLWPQWLLPYVTDAQALTKMEKYGDAANIYRRVLGGKSGATQRRRALSLA